MRLSSRLFSLIAFAMLSIGNVIARAVNFAIDVVATAAEPFRLTNEPTLALSTPGGDQIDAATFQHSRHEAGVRRRSADRNI